MSLYSRSRRVYLLGDMWCTLGRSGSVGLDRDASDGGARMVEGRILEYN